MTKAKISIRIAAAASLFVSTTAFAKDYASPGVIEAGGSIAILKETEDSDNGGQTDVTGFQVRPTVGYYVADGFELLGTITTESFALDAEGGNKASIVNFGLGAGAGYFMKVGTARVGPLMLVRFSQQTTDINFVGLDGKVTENGPGITMGLQAKVPVGGGGVITAGLGLDYDQRAQETKVTGFPSSDDDGTVIRFGTSIGFLVFF